jgi:hypothetical protein
MRRHVQKPCHSTDCAARPTYHAGGAWRQHANKTPFPGPYGRLRRPLREGLRGAWIPLGCEISLQEFVPSHDRRGRWVFRRPFHDGRKERAGPLARPPDCSIRYLVDLQPWHESPLRYLYRLQHEDRTFAMANHQLHGQRGLCQRARSRRAVPPIRAKPSQSHLAGHVRPCH